MDKFYTVDGSEGEFKDLMVNFKNNNEFKIIPLAVVNKWITNLTENISW